jgi:hypothetical protein
MNFFRWQCTSISLHPVSFPLCHSFSLCLSHFVYCHAKTNPAACQWHVVCRVRARQLQCLHRAAPVPVVSVRHVSARQRPDGLPAVPGGIVSGRRERVRVSAVHGRHLHGRLWAAAVHGVRPGEVWPYALVAVSSRPFIRVAALFVHLIRLPMRLVSSLRPHRRMHFLSFFASVLRFNRFNNVTNATTCADCEPGQFSNDERGATQCQVRYQFVWVSSTFSAGALESH